MISDKTIETFEKVPHAAFGTFGEFFRVWNDNTPPDGDPNVPIHEADLEVLAQAVAELVEIARQSEITAATAAAEAVVMSNEWTAPEPPTPTELPAARSAQQAAARARAIKQEGSPI